MLGAIVEELVGEGAVQGTLKGGGTAWTPAVYSRTQQEAVLSFYRYASLCWVNPRPRPYCASQLGCHSSSCA